MSANETGPFDNDDAADFVGDLNDLKTETDVAAALEKACRAVLVDGYLEMPTVAVGVAAAALLLAIRAGAASPPALQNVLTVSPVVAQALMVVPAELRLLASSALSRALTAEDNEWFELWSDADLLDDVAEAIAPYQQALAA